MDQPSDFDRELNKSSVIIDQLFDIVNNDSLLTTQRLVENSFKFVEKLKEVLLLSAADERLLFNAIRRKIYDESLQFRDDGTWVNCTESVLYSLRAYCTLLKWFNDDETTTEQSIRRKVFDHMLELLDSNIIIIDDDNDQGFVNRHESPSPEYNSPEELVRNLRPYVMILKWLHDEEVKPIYYDKIPSYDPRKLCGNLIAHMWRFLYVDNNDKCDVHKVLDIVHTHVFLLKKRDNKDEEPAEKKQTTTTSNPIMDGLSEDDRKLLKRFTRKDQAIALQVFHEFREYKKQVKDSEGFDFDTYPGSFDHMTPIHPVGLFSCDLKNIDYKSLAELAIAEYAEGKIKFMEAVRVNVKRHWHNRYYYLTFLGHYGGSVQYYKTLVRGTWNTVIKKEDYKVMSFKSELTKYTKAERVTRASTRRIAQNLEREVKKNKPKAGRVKRRSSKYISHVSKSKNHKTCEKHMVELSHYRNAMDMSDVQLLQKFREADRSKAKPLIKEIRQYFEQVLNSEGFHIGKYPGFFPGVTSIIKPFKWSLWSIDTNLLEKLGELSIQTYNEESGFQFVFESITEVNVSEDFHYHLYISLLAGTGDNVSETFQAIVLVNMLLLGDYKIYFVRKANR